MRKLKASEVAGLRSEWLAKQGGRCALCMDIIGPTEQAVLDHDHATGHVRGVLHAGCNAMLGHIENNRPRYLLKGARLGRMLRAAFDYIHGEYSGNPLHHTHRTVEEKRLLVNKRARLKRAKAKKAEQ